MKNKIRSRCPPRWVRDVVFAPRKYELHVDVGNGVDPLSALEQMSEKGFARIATISLLQKVVILESLWC